MKKSRRRRTTHGCITGKILENGINAMVSMRFEIFDDWRSYEKERHGFLVKDRYVIKNYPQETIYGTVGRKEDYIVGRVCRPGPLIADKDGVVRAIVEAKFQEVSGSTDEKLPFIRDSFIVSSVPNWIVLFDGNFWEHGRGKRAVEWLKLFAYEMDLSESRRLKVVDRMSFQHLILSVWGEA